MDNNEEKQNKRVEEEVLSQIQGSLEDSEKAHIRESAEGASLEVPRSQEEEIRDLTNRLEHLNKDYTLGLDSEQAEFFTHLKFLNENFFFDRPMDPEELLSDQKDQVKGHVKKILFPLIKNTLNTVFERQRSFNGELVKLLNRLSEVFGNQRDYNMAIIKFCERTIDHYRLMEDMERRLDDFFTYATRIAVLEEEVDLLRGRLDKLEHKDQPGSKGKVDPLDLENLARSSKKTSRPQKKGKS